MIYDAFISYRHSDLDTEIAKKIHVGLESYKIPASTQKKYGKKSIARVFRDQDELPIGSDLDDNITKALSESEFLIVICSPRTPESEWVQKEIETFIRLHDREHILAVLVEGEPNESFPALLLTDENGENVEPLAADVRGETAKARNEKLKTELLRLAAPLIGCSFDDLKQRHRERRLRQIYTSVCLASSFLAVFGIGFAIYNAHMAAKIDHNYKKAIENQYRYMADKSMDLCEDGYRKDAALLAVEALHDEKDKMPYVPQVERALSEALHTYATGNILEKDGMLEHDSPVLSMNYDADGCHMITADKNDKIYMWDVAGNNKLITTVDAVIDESGRTENVVAYNHVGEELIVVTSNGVYGYDLTNAGLTADEKWSVKMEGCAGAVISAAKQTAIVTDSNTLYKVDLAGHEIERSYALEDTAIFLEDVKYDENLDRVYATCGKTGGNNSKVMAVDLKNGKITYFESKSTCVSQIAFTDDDALIISSYDADELMKNVLEPYTVYVQKMDVQTGEERWCYTTKFTDAGFSSNAQSILKYRNYQDASDNVHKQVIFTGNDKILCIDADSGEEISVFEMGGGVRALLLSAVGPLGYAALSTGNIEILNLQDGTRLNDFMIETDLTLTDLKIRGGVFVASEFSSPDALVMKYPVGRDIQQLYTASEGVQTVMESPDGKVIALRSGFVGQNNIAFISWADGAQTEVKAAEEKTVDNMIRDCFFTADNQFFYYDFEGKAGLIDPVTLEETVLSDGMFEIFHGGSLAADPGKRYVSCYTRDEVSLFDLVKRVQIGKWDVSEVKPAQAAVNGSGDKIYLLLDGGGLALLDVKSGETKPFAGDAVFDSLSCYGRQSMALGKDGDHLAVTCKNGKMKILNTKDGSLLREMDFLGFNNAFFAFDDAQKCLITQGDDYYICIYDLATGEKLYTSERQYSSMTGVLSFMDGKRLAAVVPEGMIVLETDSYIPVAEIADGRLISSAGRVILTNESEVYGFPYQTTASLREDALQQFEGDALSEDKRTKYHMNFEEE